MTFIISLTISLTIVIILSVFFKEEAHFWLDKVLGKLKRKKKEETQKRGEPISKYCGFRDWSESGGEICTLFQLEDNSEYRVNKDICRQCVIWERYEKWMNSGKKEKLSVTLKHTFYGSKPMVVETDNLNPEMDSGLKFDDFIIKKRRVPWAGKAAIAFLTLITYLVVHFSGVFNTPIVKAMPDTFYFYDVGDKAVASNWNMRAADPSSAADTTTKCNSTSSGDTTKICALYPGTSRNFWEATYAGPKKRGWMTDNDDLLNGTIASGNWTVYVKYNFVLNGNCSYTKNRISFRVWKADANLNNRTILTGGAWLFDAISTGTNTYSHSFNPGSVDFDNEVIHIEFGWYIVTECFLQPDDTLTFYVDEGGSTEKLTTPLYSPVPEKSLYFAVVMPFIPIAIKKFRLRKYLKNKG